MNPSSLMPLLALVAVLLAIPAVLWLLRRGGLGGVPQNGLLKQVASLALSPTQRVVIVELSQGTQAQWLVLGVSPDRVNTLSTLDAPDRVPDALRTPQAATVQRLLQRWRGGQAGADDGPR